MRPRAVPEVQTVRGNVLAAVLKVANLVEFWTVGRTEYSSGVSGITALRNLVVLFADPLEVVKEWQSLVAMHKLSGKQTHDAHIVAIMRVHSVKSILTFNERHFNRFRDIAVLNPAHVK